MTVQELPGTLAAGAVRLVRLPLELAVGVSELIADRMGGRDDQAIDTMPTSAPPRPQPAKPAPRPRKPTARPKPKTSAKPHRTPASKSPAAEQPEVVAEQTEGLEDATDRAISERRSLR